jgi:hypothetical protein
MKNHPIISTRNIGHSKYGPKIKTRGGFLYANPGKNPYWQTFDGKPSNVSTVTT